MSNKLISNFCVKLHEDFNESIHQANDANGMTAGRDEILRKEEQVQNRIREIERECGSLPSSGDVFEVTPIGEDAYSVFVSSRRYANVTPKNPMYELKINLFSEEF